MSNIDISKPVRFIKPNSGEENLVYQVTNVNEETGRCYVRLISKLPGLSSNLAPEELVSFYDVENLD